MTSNTNLPKFYKCPICGNIIEMIYDSSVIPYCCNQEMEEMIAIENDVGLEKHVPVYAIAKDCVIVDIGSIPHPMTQEHHIVWVELVTDKGIYRKDISSIPAPHLHFRISNCENVIAIYCYCNIHGLWVKK